MIDGITTGYTGNTGFAQAQFNTPMTITLKKVYTINRINVLLWDGDTRYYQYKVEASTDNLTWTTIVDKTSGIWRSWQKDTITSIDAKYVRITGTYNTGNNRFHVVEMEVYGSSPPPSTVPTGYTLVWSDEFNGVSINTSKWNVGNGSSRGNPNLTYTPSAVSVSNGNLVITGSMLNGKYYSGDVYTKNKFYLTYGYIEGRMKLSKGKGVWPSFWMIPQNGAWPPEIDIFELENGEYPGSIYFTYHYPGSCLNNHCSLGHADYDPLVDYSAAYHTYAVKWETGSLTWYIDGVQRYQLNSSDAPIVNINNFIEITQYLVASGGWPNGAPTSSDLPVNYYIDYVRVYQK